MTVRIVLAPLLSLMLLAGCAGGARVISGFGEKVDAEGRPRNNPHRGVDVWGNPHDPILAAADGRVVTAREEPAIAGAATCGKYILLEHDQDLIVRGTPVKPRTKYCHLSEFAVAEDAVVKRGQVIGSIGTTGWRRSPIQTTGYEHVHWELSVFPGGALDPIPMTVGCFDPKQTYPTDKLVLTYPVKC